MLGLLYGVAAVFMFPSVAVEGFGWAAHYRGRGRGLPCDQHWRRANDQGAGEAGFYIAPMDSPCPRGASWTVGRDAAPVVNLLVVRREAILFGFERVPGLTPGGRNGAALVAFAQHL